MVPRKKAKTSHAGDGNSDLALVGKGSREGHGGEMVSGHIARGLPGRTSSLAAPTMLLTGHLDGVNAVAFHPDGRTLASGSHDKKIFLWNTYGDCSNYCVLSGHKNALLSVSYADDGEALVSCSPDMTVRGWDTRTGEQIHVLREHTAVVNCCAATPQGPVLVASASDDASVKLWDMRARKAARTLVDEASSYSLCAVDISEDGEYVYAGGIDNCVKGWDLRKDSELCLRLEGHEDTITGLAVSPSGTHVLTNAMDMTLRSWDVRPFVDAEDRRCVRVFSGHQHSQEKNLLRCAWSLDGKRVSGGSSDSMVHVWDVASGELEYSLPGHSGSVNEVCWSPLEAAVVCSASSDRALYLGELMS